MEREIGHRQEDRRFLCVPAEWWSSFIDCENRSTHRNRQIDLNSVTTSVPRGGCDTKAYDKRPVTPVSMLGESNLEIAYRLCTAEIMRAGSVGSCIGSLGSPERDKLRHRFNTIDLVI